MEYSHQIVKSKNIKNVGYLHVVINHGYLNDTSETIEYSHIIEHLMVYFTKKDTKDYKEPQAILDAHGITYSAFTSIYNTTYVFSFQKKHTRFITEFINDTLKNFKVHNDIFQNELKSIVIEIKREKDKVYSKHTEKAYKTLFPNTPLSYSYSDRIKSTNEATPEKVMKFYRNIYKPENICFLYMGDIDQSAISGKKGFPLIRTSNILYRPPLKNIVTVSPKKDQEAIPIIAFFKVNFDTFSTKKYISYVITNILGEGLSSPLYRRFRNELGLIYSLSVSEDDSVNSEINNITISTRLKSKSKIDFFIKELSIFLENYKITHDDLKKAKEAIRLDKYKTRNCEYSEHLVDYYSQFIIKNKPIKHHDIFYINCEKVTLEQCQDFMNKYLNPNNMFIVRNN